MAVFTINNVKYDLAEGAVFRIDNDGSDTTVNQLSNDLSNVQPDRTSCSNFVTADPTLTKPTEESTAE